MKEAPTLEALTALLASPATDTDKAWNIYRYLAANLDPKMPVRQARDLLAAYIKLGVPRPSVVHSLMLSMAVKTAETYPDFRLPGFVGVWGLQNLMPDDLQPRTLPDGRTFPPLARKVGVALTRYAVTHPADPPVADLKEWAAAQAAQAGFLPALDMVAVKVFEGENNGRKTRMVKLIGTDGTELAADWHMFHCKPWEIAGRSYTVLPRRSQKSGAVRVDVLAPSATPVAEAFGRVIGYVDRFDAGHNQYHIYDNQSRHFVAEKPQVRIAQGQFVWFAPVVPAHDKFKTAIVLAAETPQAGIAAFGATPAKITYVDTAKGYYSFTTPEGVRGSGQLPTQPSTLTPGQTVSVVAFLRRSKDGEKRLHAALLL